jgi:hypothetical protein
MYEYPPEFNEATKEILQEYALIRLKILASLINTLITKEDWGLAGETTGARQGRRPLPWFLGGISAITRQGFVWRVSPASNPFLLPS